MARPTSDPDWAESIVNDPTSGQDNRVEPPAAWKTNGWSYQEKPPRNYDNWVKWNLGQWVKYLDTVATRTATYVVAASDASTESQEKADAVCDGTADEVEINAAITAVAATGGVVVLSEGTFNTAAAITMGGTGNVHLRGAGPVATTIKITAATATDFNMLDITSSGFSVVSDMRLSGNGASVTGEHNGIVCAGASGVTLRDLNVIVMRRNSTRGNGIVVGTSSNVHLLNCYVWGVDGAGFETDGASSLLRATSCMAATSQLAGWDIGGPGSFVGCWSASNLQQGFLVSGDGAVLSGCVADSNSDDGFEVTGDENRVDGCRSVGNANAGFYLSGTHNAASGCTAQGNTEQGVVMSAASRASLSDSHVMENQLDGVRLNGGCSQCRINDNTISTNGQAADNTHYGINVNSADNCVITDNDVYRGAVAPQQAWGIGGSTLTGGANSNRIYNNDFSTSGATASIEAAAQSQTIPQWVASSGAGNSQDSITAANRV